MIVPPLAAARLAPLFLPARLGKLRARVHEAAMLPADPRTLFEIPADIAWFNCASIGPLPRAAREAIEAGAARRAQPWRVTMSHWIDDYEERRALFAELAGVEADAIALIPSVSYGVAVAARNLDAAPGKQILVLAEDFPSDVYTWRNFAAEKGCSILTVSRRPGESWTEAVLERLDDKVAVVAVPNVQWTDGALVDLVRIGARAREIGAALVVDASQSFGVMPLDLDAVRPDFLITVGYKWLLGPYGLAYLYADEKYRSGNALEQNWLSRQGSEDFSSLIDYRDEYRPGARRYDMGERSALELNNGAVESLRLIRDWGVGVIAERLAATTARIESEAKKLGLAISSAPVRGGHLLGIELPREAVAPAFSTLRERGVYVAFRGSAIRIAAHVYNDEADVDRLVAALAAL
jgi:selenocysteine lyase/cysteine desulfurase